MLPISHCEWPIAKTSKKAGLVLSLLVLKAGNFSDRPQARHCPRIRLSGFRGH